MIMYPIVFFALLTLWISTTCKKEHPSHEDKLENHSEMPSSCSTSRSKIHSSSLSKSKLKGKKKSKKSRRQKASRARKSADLGATPREKVDLIKKGMKRSVEANPWFDEVRSDGNDEKKSRISKLKPKEQPMNRKELLIALGAQRQETAYPTMDDIVSDWESKEDDATKKEGDEKKDAGNKEEVDFELELLECNRKGDQWKKGFARKKK